MHTSANTIHGSMGRDRRMPLVLAINMIPKFVCLFYSALLSGVGRLRELVFGGSV